MIFYEIKAKLVISFSRKLYVKNILNYNHYYLIVYIKNSLDKTLVSATLNKPIKKHNFCFLRPL